MSPRSSCRYGSSFSYQAPVPPKINLFTSKWSPISSVLSIDADGILKACTMKLVPKSARITVTSSDSRYSEIVVCSARCSCFFSGACSSISVTVCSGIPPQPFASGRSSCSKALRAARCSASFFVLPSPVAMHSPQSKLRFEKPFGGRDRFLRPRDIPPLLALDPARVPAKRICDRTPRCAHRAPQAPARTAPFAVPRARHPVRHRGKQQPPLLRRHQPAASACPARRFSPPRALPASAPQGGAGAQRPPGSLHLRFARGFWKAALRSTPEKSPGDIRSQVARGRHLRGTPASHCPEEARQRQALRRLLSAIRGLLNCGSAPSRGVLWLKTCIPNSPQTLRLRSGYLLA